jgi:hypothetical protein
MLMVKRSLATAVLMLILAAPAAAPAQDSGSAPTAAYLQAEWSLEQAQSGRARVVGYLSNSHIKDAANVWLRVEQIAADGAVSATYRRRVVGDVPARERMFFEVPVSQAAASYRVIVEAVDWITDCR